MENIQGLESLLVIEKKGTPLCCIKLLQTEDAASSVDTFFQCRRSYEIISFCVGKEV